MTDNTKESCESIDLEKVREEIHEQKIDPVSPTNITKMEELLFYLNNCSFQGRNLGEGWMFSKRW